LLEVLAKGGEPMAEELTRADALTLHSLLEELWDYMDNRADGEYVDGVPRGNREARFAAEIQDHLARLERAL
jgi:hypothetical protein